MLTGEIKKRCAEELASYCTAFQERRAKVTEETVDLFMARRPLVWGGSENLKSVPICDKAAAEGGAPTEGGGGGDGKMTKNQLKKLEKQKQIEEKKAQKAKEKEAAKAAAGGA